MRPDVIKLGMHNQLIPGPVFAESPSGLSGSPVLAIGAGTVIDKYADLTTDAENLALLNDGDQDLPCFFSSATARVYSDFAVAVAVGLLGLVNHNCWGVGDSIDVIGSADAISWDVVETIASPNRSADIFWPLRGNDVFVNLASAGYRYWGADLKKASGTPFLGELFVALPQYGYLEFNPAPGWRGKVDFTPDLMVHRVEGGGSYRYERGAPLLGRRLPFPMREGADVGASARRTEHLLQHAVYGSAGPLRSSPYRQLLVIADDRVCQFGRFAPGRSLAVAADGAAGGQANFAGPFAERFYGDGAFDV